MEQEIKKLQKEIDEIKARNSRVELDKLRETSWMRKIIIIILTYIVIVLFFYFAGLPNPFLNSIVPTVAFMLSTLGLNLFKKTRIKNKK